MIIVGFERSSKSVSWLPIIRRFWVIFCSLYLSKSTKSTIQRHTVPFTQCSIWCGSNLYLSSFCSIGYPMVQGCASWVTTEPFLCSKGIFFSEFFCVLFCLMHCVAICSALASKHRSHTREKALLLIVKTKVGLNISAFHIGFYQTIKSLSPTLTKQAFMQHPGQ